MSTPSVAATARTTSSRLPGPDVVRAVALIGVVVMNFHGYLILRDGGTIGEGWAADLFDPWDGPLSTRFAATFVLVAGVGVTLMTRRSVADRRAGNADRITELRWRLVRRGLALYAAGLALDVIWPGTILPYYGAMFVIAAAVFTWRTRWLIALGASAAIAGASIRAWRFERSRSGDSTAWLTDPDVGSLRDHVFGAFVNGTHPLLPWLAFLCAGMILGRTLTTTWWRPAALGGGALLVALAGIAETASTSTTSTLTVLVSLDPVDRGLVYVASALGTALIAYAATDWLALRYPSASDPLRRAGQMTLSLYIAHVLVFNLVVDWLGWIEPGGVDVALTFAIGFWAIGIASAVGWQRRFGLGPVERIYRAAGG